MRTAESGSGLSTRKFKSGRSKFKVRNPEAEFDAGEPGAWLNFSLRFSLPD